MDGVDGEIEIIIALFKWMCTRCTEVFGTATTTAPTSADTQPKSKIKFPETSQGMNWMCE